LNPSSPIRILLIETDPALSAPVQHILLERLALRLFDLTTVGTLAEAYREMIKASFDLVVMDLDPKADPDLVPLVRFREVAPQTPVVVLLADKHQARALDVLQHGAADYLLKNQLREDALPAFLLRAVERNARDKAIRESEERFRLMIENASDLLLMIDPSGVITFAGPSTQRIVGWRSAHLTGRNVLDFIHRDDVRTFLEQLEGAFEAGELPSVVHFRLKLADERFLPMEGKGRIVSDAEGRRTCVLNCHDVSHRVKMEEELRALSHRDELTGLHNRRAFVSFIDQQLKVAQRAKMSSVCLLMLDLDGFKSINDTHGHKEGDRALIEASRILRNTFREADIIARLGGDEFVVFLSDSLASAQLETVKKRLYDGVESWNRAEDRRYRLSMSVGAVHHDPRQHLTPEDLLKHADELMYRQKREKKRAAALAAEAESLAGAFDPPIESIQGRN